MNLATGLCPGLIPIILNYKAKLEPFFSYRFDAVDSMLGKKKMLFARDKLSAEE